MKLVTSPYSSWRKGRGEGGGGSGRGMANFATQNWQFVLHNPKNFMANRVNPIFNEPVNLH